MAGPATEALSADARSHALLICESSDSMTNSVSVALCRARAASSLGSFVSAARRSRVRSMTQVRTRSRRLWRVRVVGMNRGSARDTGPTGECPPDTLRSGTEDRTAWTRPLRSTHKADGRRRPDQGRYRRAHTQRVAPWFRQCTIKVVADRIEDSLHLRHQAFLVVEGANLSVLDRHEVARRASKKVNRLRSSLDLVRSLIVELKRDAELLTRDDQRRLHGASLPAHGATTRYESAPRQLPTVATITHEDVSVVGGTRSAFGGGVRCSTLRPARGSGSSRHPSRDGGAWETDRRFGSRSRLRQVNDQIVAPELTQTDGPWFASGQRPDCGHRADANQARGSAVGRR